MNYKAIALPSLLYLASVGTCLSLFCEPEAILLANVTDTVTSIFWCYHVARQEDYKIVFDMTYLSICLSLNILLTLMIIVRLILHNRNARNAIGASSGAGALYKAIIAMLIESSALYAVGFLLYIISIVSSSRAGLIFSLPLGEIQVGTRPCLPPHPGTLSNCSRTGHRAIPDYSTSRESDCSDERCRRHLSGLRSDSLQEGRGFDWWPDVLERRDFWPVLRWVPQNLTARLYLLCAVHPSRSCNLPAVVNKQLRQALISSH